MTTLEAGITIGAIAGLAPSSRIRSSVSGKNLFKVASPSTRATTVSPGLASVVRRTTTRSPSWIPSSIIERPRTSRTKWSPWPTISGGTRASSVSPKFSIGDPAATAPDKGRLIAGVASDVVTRERPRFWCLSFSKNPFLTRRLTCFWAEAVLEKPKCVEIS